MNKAKYTRADITIATRVTYHTYKGKDCSRYLVQPITKTPEHIYIQSRVYLYYTRLQQYEYREGELVGVYKHKNC